MDLKVQGKTDLITGGSHGVGKATATSLAKEGCRVAIIARGIDNLNLTPAQLESSSNGHLAIQADINSYDQIDFALRKVNNSFEKIDILINNAGHGERWGLEDPLATDKIVLREVTEKISIHLYAKPK
jgi:short-subunit dehydrogenase